MEQLKISKRVKIKDNELEDVKYVLTELFNKRTIKENVFSILKNTTDETEIYLFTETGNKIVITIPKQDDDKLLNKEAHIIVDMLYEPNKKGGD